MRLEFSINVYDQSGNLNVSETGAVAMGPVKMVSCLKCQTEQSMSNVKCQNCGQYITSGPTCDPQDGESMYSHY